MNRKNRISRRDFINIVGIAGMGTALAACSRGELPTPQSSVSKQTKVPTLESIPTSQAALGGNAYLAVARGEDPGVITQRAISALGGIERFVKSGDDVIIKPNICTDYHTYEYAATTNPQVVAALVSLCLGAGARRVRVMDNPFGGTAASAYKKSGIADAVSQVGGEMEVMVPAKFQKISIPEGVDIKEWWFYADILDTDVLIDVPIAKHHGGARLTLGCKNLMGTIQERGLIHLNLHQRIADLTSLLRPDLTVIDAYRMLMKGGPTGGDLNSVKLEKTVIASADVVAADTYACGLFGLTPQDVPYVDIAANMGIGTGDLGSIKIEEVAV